MHVLKLYLTSIQIVESRYHSPQSYKFHGLQPLCTLIGMGKKKGGIKDTKKKHIYYIYIIYLLVDVFSLKKM